MNKTAFICILFNQNIITMKKTGICLLALVSVTFIANAQKTAAKKPAAAKAVTGDPVTMKNAVDSFSYAAGMNIAQSMKQQGVPSVNGELFKKAMEDVYNGKTTLMNEEQSNMTLQEKLQAFMQKKLEAEKAKSSAYLEQNKKKPGVKTLPSGLQYEVLQAGTPGGKKATSPQDTVVVHYRGTLTNGEKFDASYDRGEPATFPLNQVIRGWTEIGQLMTVGDKWKVTIPSELAYGEQGRGPVIGPNQVLVFELELIDVKPVTVK